MKHKLVFVGIGGNLPSRRFGTPRAVLAAAVAALPSVGVSVRRRSRWFVSAPVPPGDQPDFVNGVLEVATGGLDPAGLLKALHAVEDAFGRERGARNAARVLDLDLLAWGDLVLEGGEGPVLPHPRLHLRAFVLRPLAELAPDWRHPVLGQTATELLASLPPGQRAEPLAAAPAERRLATDRKESLS